VLVFPLDFSQCRHGL
jgi:hypothetical protein